MPRRATSEKPGKPGKGASELYDRVTARAQTAIMAASRTARDIAPAPEIVDRKRRDAAMASLEFFLRVYYPGTFVHPWSPDHLKVIKRLEDVIRNGGQFALAMPRSAGKTSMTERAALWAIVTGLRHFVVIIAANESLAEMSLARIKAELESNPLLYADFPKAVYPIVRLEAQSRRTVGQLFDGERTRISWQRKRLVLPTMPGPDNEASGAVLHVAGLGAAIRGLSHVGAEGRTIRPDLLLVDDPQDRESARSVVQTSERLAILNGDLLGLAGPDKRIAALTTCTIICRGDLADQLLDPERNPAWQGERYKLVYRWPDRVDLWEEYARLRAEGFKPGGDRGLAATEFYRTHRAEMDAGAEVAWPQRHNADELSALQHAYNLRLDRGEAAFGAEYQNEPPEEASLIDALDPVAIARRCGGFERGVAPPEVEKVTAFIDVGQSLLWYMVAGWAEDFSAYVLDYGAYPEQRSRVFAARNASPTLEERHPSTGGGEGAVYAGLAELVERLFAREWRRSDGAVIPLGRLMIDSGWSTDVVRLFVRQSPRREFLTPSKGIGVGPAQVPISDYRRRPGEKIGDGWILGVAAADRLRLLRFDANAWKTRLAGMLTRPMGMRGGVTLHGDRPVDHELLALQLASEYPTRTEARGNAVNVWTRRPDRDNHLWDCLIGVAVAASLEGLTPLAGLGAEPARPAAKRVSFAEMYRRKHGART